MAGFYYKALLSTCDKYNIIADCDVQTGSSFDSTNYIKRIMYQKYILKLSVKRVVADRGFGFGSIYKILFSHCIVPNIPNRDNINTIDRTQFTYSYKKDLFNCRNKNTFHPYSINYGNNKKYRVIDTEKCKDCLFNSECLPNTPKGRARYLNRSIYFIEHKLIHKMKKPYTFKSNMKKRMWKIEGIFGEGKNYHCLGRSQYKSLTDMTIQV